MFSQRIFVTSFALFLTVFAANGQPGYHPLTDRKVQAHNYRNHRPYRFESNNELCFSIGIWPMRPNQLFEDDDYRDERKAPFEISGEYMRRLTKRLSVGLDFTYIPVLKDDWDEDTWYGTDKSQQYRRNTAFGNSDRYEESIFIAMPTIRLEWLKMHNFSMYSRCAIGFGIEFDRVSDKVHTGFAFQAVPVGLLIGRDVYARIEFPAFGYQGILNAGLGYRF